MCRASRADRRGVAVDDRRRGLAPNVIALRGTTSRDYTADFSYDTKARTVNGFRVNYACRGKPATTTGTCTRSSTVAMTTKRSRASRTER